MADGVSHPLTFKHYYWAIVRILMGLIFLWAFFDKLLGLGFATCRDSSTGVVSFMCDKAWINGGSPTYGFLTYGVHGPLADFYHSIASSSVVAWLFMLGLLFVGFTLTFGIMIRLGSLAGSLMLFLMWTALLLPEHHPFIDDHIVYAFVMLGFAFVHTCRHLGFGNWWSNLSFVKKYWILR
jgi:thiosulfate dehydrogenase [quinone] large subunit